MITKELERIKVAHAHVPATAEEVEILAAPHRSLPRPTQAAKAGDEATTPRTRRITKTTVLDSAGPGEEPAGSGESRPDAPRKRGRKAAGEVQPKAAPAPGLREPKMAA